MADLNKPMSPADADVHFGQLLCVGGPAHGRVVDMPNDGVARQTWVDIEHAETYVRRRWVRVLPGPLGTPQGYMQQVLVWSKLPQQEHQAAIGQLLANAWFQSGLPVDVTAGPPNMNGGSPQ